MNFNQYLTKVHLKMYSGNDAKWTNLIKVNQLETVFSACANNHPN